MGETLIPRLIVHGGAGDWTGFDEDTVLRGVHDAAEAGAAILRAGGSALDAVEAATRILEDHPLFDAGYGSYMNEWGEVEMDAIIADGEHTRFGAVAGVRRVRHAITLARGVLERTDHCFFVGEGADHLATKLGMPIIANVELVSDGELADFRQRHNPDSKPSAHGTGTVGACAYDATGRVAAATSTGGTHDKPKGRVGDSPLFGSGGYADPAGAASATGVGENIMRYFLCKRAVDACGVGLDAATAARSAVTYLNAQIPDPEAGLILIGADGRVGAAHTTQAMPIAWLTADGQIHTAMRCTADMQFE
jgi:beta-aspartyl-peptidase (threonine type)